MSADARVPLKEPFGSLQTARRSQALVLASRLRSGDMQQPRKAEPQRLSCAIVGRAKWWPML
jgi:hypothetical protein